MSLGAKARCIDTVSSGVKPCGGVTPHCYWVGDCTKHNQCFWARFHQLPNTHEPVAPADQADLFQ